MLEKPKTFAMSALSRGHRRSFLLYYSLALNALLLLRSLFPDTRQLLEYYNYYDPEVLLTGWMVNAIPQQPPENTASSCAILFFGLPRAFEAIVLPSISTNILQPSLSKRNCDVFVHYYNQTWETPGRSGRGGAIRSDEVLLLEEAVRKINPKSTVHFQVTQEDDFFAQYQELLHNISTIKDPDGTNLLYFPWRDPSYENPGTTNNIVKMWHSIQSVYQLMEQTGQNKNVAYSHVAMLRSDVMYVTPVNVLEFSDTIVLPGFANYPSGDRSVFGPAPAVRIWATERFQRLDDHVHSLFTRGQKGLGMHSETFVHSALLPSMRTAVPNIRTRNHPSMCFFRARADFTVRVDDCGHLNIAGGDTTKTRTHVEGLLGRACGEYTMPNKTMPYATLLCEPP